MRALALLLLVVGCAEDWSPTAANLSGTYDLSAVCAPPNGCGMSFTPFPARLELALTIGESTCAVPGFDRCEAVPLFNADDTVFTVDLTLCSDVDASGTCVGDRGFGELAPQPDGTLVGDMDYGYPGTQGTLRVTATPVD